MNQGLEKVDYVVKTSCESDADFNYKTYYQRLVFAQRFMREEAGMKLRVGTNFKERRITMPDSKRIPFPDDFTAYVTVGFEHNGNVLTLAYNPDMTLSDYNSCGDPVAVQGGNVTGLAQNISDYAYYGDYGFYNYGTYRFGFGQRAPHFGWGGGYVA